MLEYWYQALASDKGICLESEDREAFRQKLYRARAEAADTSLDALSIVLSPTDSHQLWILKNAKA